ncbi:DUF4249 family protein [Porphyromonas sp.]|uniref:DUF4249 family protein n=1 Tax=Porphyromonas sp. TaxID=1924944 RepID=UPI0026DCE312|nr:DUF4249 family protein [Porphyromonas sp.]MDO4770950.1 DUF4249 family protein [Porphyromonas sp.]
MKRILIFLSLLPLFLACDKMEKTLEIDKSMSRNPRLVVNGEVVADSLPRLYISKTLPVNATYQRDRLYEAFGVKEATVECYINDKLAETRTVHFGDLDDSPGRGFYPARGFECFYKGMARPRPGDKVRFEVSSPDLEPVSVEVYLPVPPTFRVMKREIARAPVDAFYPQPRSSSIIPVLKMQVEVKKSDKDPDVGIAVGYYGGVKNSGGIVEYSRQNLRVTDDIIFSQTAVKLSKYFNKNTYKFDDGYRFPYFSTSEIVGDTYTMRLMGRINILPEEEMSEPTKLVFNCMDPFYHEWAGARFGLKDISVDDNDFFDASDDTDNPFAEPVLDSTNVRGGRGIVLGYTRVEVQVVSK